MIEFGQPVRFGFVDFRQEGVGQSKSGRAPMRTPRKRWPREASLPIPLRRSGHSVRLSARGAKWRGRGCRSRRVGKDPSAGAFGSERRRIDPVPRTIRRFVTRIAPASAGSHQIPLFRKTDQKIAESGGEGLDGSGGLLLTARILPRLAGSNRKRSLREASPLIPKAPTFYDMITFPGYSLEKRFVPHVGQPRVQRTGQPTHQGPPAPESMVGPLARNERHAMR